MHLNNNIYYIDSIPHIYLIILRPADPAPPYDGHSATILT